MKGLFCLSGSCLLSIFASLIPTTDSYAQTATSKAACMAMVMQLNGYYVQKQLNPEYINEPCATPVPDPIPAGGFNPPGAVLAASYGVVHDCYIDRIVNGVPSFATYMKEYVVSYNSSTMSKSPPVNGRAQCASSPYLESYFTMYKDLCNLPNGTQRVVMTYLERSPAGGLPKPNITWTPVKSGNYIVYYKPSIYAPATTVTYQAYANLGVYKDSKGFCLSTTDKYTSGTAPYPAITTFGEWMSMPTVYPEG